MSRLVDGHSILSEFVYRKGAVITLTPNTIYTPEDDDNNGWDMLIVLEAFEESIGGNTSKKRNEKV